MRPTTDPSRVCISVTIVLLWLSPCNNTSLHFPCQTVVPLSKNWEPTEPSWSSQPVLRLCRSPLDTASLLVGPSLALQRPLVVLPRVQPLESDRPHHHFQTCQHLVYSELAIVIVMSSICSSSESDEYEPELLFSPVVRALCGTISTGNAKTLFDSSSSSIPHPSWYTHASVPSS